MTSYINPVIVPIPDPYGADAVIEQMRLKLATLPWLEKIFGRATIQHAKGDGLQDVIFPEVWGPGREPLNVMMNDNLKSYCFFVGRDPETAAPYDPYSDLYLRRPISTIIWANLTKIDPTKIYRYSDFLKMQLMGVLSRVGAFTLQNVYESYPRVFEGFTITDTFRTYLKPPYWAIRVDGYVSYPLAVENCSPVVTGGGDFNSDFGDDFTNQ